jgi:hypothetical protein
VGDVRGATRHRAAGRLAWSLWALFAAFLVVGFPLGYVQHAPGVGNVFSGIALAVAFGAYATVGALIASRRPENSIGWIFLGIGLLLSFGAFCQFYAHYALAVAPGAPLGVWAAWVAAWYWFPMLGTATLITMILFPTGAPLTPRWRPLLWIAIADLGALTLLTALSGRLDGGSYNVPNPIGLERLGLIESESWGGVLFALLLGATAVALLSLVLRFRRSAGVERQQLKWFTFAGAVVVGWIFLSDVAFSRLEKTIPPSLLKVLLSWGDVMFGLAVATLPISAGIAILRYRLYDIDRIINRTLVYAGLTLFLAGVYALCVVAIPAWAGAGSGSELVIAASTLLVAALFRPLRTRIQGFIDRRFYRSRFDAHRVVDDFSERLRDRVELEGLTVDLLAVVYQTMQPAHASLWLSISRAAR